MERYGQRTTITVRVLRLVLSLPIFTGWPDKEFKERNDKYQVLKALDLY